MKQRKQLSRRQLLAGAGTGILLGLTRQPASAQPEPGGSRPASKPLYLHWCKPTYFKDKTEPPSRILSTRVIPGEDISITLGGGSPSLQGRIELRDGKYQAKL